MGKYNNSFIDNIIKDRNIKRIDEIVGGGNYYNWLCLKCNFKWNTKAFVIVNQKTGCPKCSGTYPLNNETVDLKLINRSIKRIGEYTNNKEYLKFQCLRDDCEYVWEANAGSVIAAGRGCPKCGGKIPLTNEIVDDRIKNTNLIRLDDVGKSNKKINWKCTLDNYQWKATPNKALNKGTGCPSCANNAKLSNEIIDQRLIFLNKNIKRVENFISGGHKKILFQCQLAECKHKWLVSPISLLNTNIGCPVCNTPGKNEKLLLKILKNNKIAFEYHFYLKKLIQIETKIFVDFYIPDANLIIELNGDQHYKPCRFQSMSKEAAELAFCRQVKRDNYLNNLCEKNNIDILWIDGRKYKFNTLDKYCNEVLLPLLKNRKII